MLELCPSDWWFGPVDFVVLSLACWRLTSLLVQEDGPWFLFARLRHVLGVRYDERSEPYGLNVVAEGITCIWCASIWVAALLCLLVFIFGRVVVLASAIPALSAAAILMERLVNNGPR
jgi:hypothetical protein